MSFPGALSAAQINKIRGTSLIAPTYQCRVNLSLVPNTNVYTARINQSSFTSPLAQFTYDGGSGTLASVRVGMTVLISHTNDRTKAFWRGRVRKAPTASILYVNEVSGERFDNDDYIFVLDDFAIIDKLARDVAGTMYIDWEVSFRQLLPLVYGLKSSYVDWVNGSDIYTQAFAPTCQAAASGATISTYLWDVGDGTITVGTANTQNITATFPPGFRHIHFTVTDSNGNSITRHIPVWAHHPTDYPVTLLTYGNLAVNADTENGYSASISAFDGVDTVLDQTLVCVWCDEMYNGTDEHIIDNLVMVGRLRTESSSTAWDDVNRDDQVSLTIEGAIPQLARLRTSAIETLLDATPTAWMDVKALTPWRVIHLLLTEFSTFSELHSYQFDDIDTFPFPVLVTVGQDIKTSIVDILDSVNAAMFESGSGECKISRKGVYLTTASRNALSTVLGMTTSDILSIDDNTRDHFSPVGSISSDGGGYNSASGIVSSYVAVAPAGAPDPGSSSSNLRGQILESDQTITEERDELKQRVGDALAEAQNEDVFALKVLDGLRFLEPSPAHWYTLTLDGSETTRGIVLTTATRWLMSAKALQFNHELGAVDVTLTLRKETQGVPGEIVEPTDVETGDYPVTLGDFDEAIEIPSVSGDSEICDFAADDGGWLAFEGTHSPGNGWRPDCVGGTSEYLDIYLEFGSPKTLLSITAIYDAVYGGGADNQNKFQCRLNTGDWVELHSFTTTTGTDVTVTQSWTGIVATAIRVIMYAGGSDCTGSLTLKQLTYQAIGAGETTLWVTFGDFADPPYTIVAGTKDSSGGNPGGCMNGGNSGGAFPSTNAQIRVDLPTPTLVTRVYMDYWKAHAAGLGLSVSAYLYDQDDVLLSTQGIAYTGAPNVWLTFDSGAISVAGVAYVMFVVFTCCSVVLLGKMDNCKVTYV